MKKRPKFLNLFKIKLPLTGVTSILHRVSGAFLFLGTPILIYFFSASLHDPESFKQIFSCFAGPLGKLIATVLAWALMHHIFAGIRYLLMDVQIGLHLAQAKLSALIVNALSLASFVFFVYWIWL